MAGPSERKVGVRCIERRIVPKTNFEFWKLYPDEVLEECGGLLLEHDAKQGLGMRCWKKDCRKFHPLEVLLSQAMEQGLLGPEQLEKIRSAISDKQEKPIRQEEEMMTEINDRKMISPQSVIMSFAKKLLQLVRLNERDVPELVKVLVENITPEHSSTYCGMCIRGTRPNEGRLIPIFRGWTRKNPNTETEIKIRTTLMACNTCGFLYEKSEGSYTAPLH